MTHIELHSSTELYLYYTRILSDFKSLFVFFPFFHVMYLFFTLSYAISSCRRGARHCLAHSVFAVAELGTAHVEGLPSLFAKKSRNE